MNRSFQKLACLVSLLLMNGLVFAQTSFKKLSTTQEFNQCSGRPLVEKYGRVSAVKVVYDRRTKELYFVRDDAYHYHHEFCLAELNYPADLEVFNVLNYSDDESRPFLLANLNYFESLNLYVLELSPVDVMRSEWIVQLYQKISTSFFAGGKMKFFLNSARLQNIRQELQGKIPLIDPSEIYKRQDFQPISRNEGFGVLRFAEDSTLSKYGPNDILVIKETPLLLPNVAGVMVSTFQTPLSHLSILGQNRGIPICAYKNAFKDRKLRSLEGKYVHYIVSGSNYSIQISSLGKAVKKKHVQVELKSDLSVDSLIDISNVGKDGKNYCGNKVYNFSLLYKLSKKGKFKTPESAFVIPFFFYERHLVQCGAAEMIDTLKDIGLNPSDSAWKMKLQLIRNKILNYKLDSTLLSAVETKMKASGKFTRFRFRSSTNAEDASGFSGAGLYESKTGELNNKKQSAEKAIKKVWASLWNEEAFFERAYYGIDQRKVMMGLLVHRSFPDEQVNGVIITQNLYRPNYYGFVVNAQLGDEAVVKPKPGQTTDQFICYPRVQEEINRGRKTIDIITLSNLNKNKLVMSEEEIQLLANECDKIKTYFYRHTKTRKSYFDFGLDLEFKLEGPSRTLYIKQVRPFNN